MICCLPMLFAYGNDMLFALCYLHMEKRYEVCICYKILI